jgi:hypothetical protein
MSSPSTGQPCYRLLSSRPARNRRSEFDSRPFANWVRHLIGCQQAYHHRISHIGPYGQLAALGAVRLLRHPTICPSARRPNVGWRSCSVVRPQYDEEWQSGEPDSVHAGFPGALRRLCNSSRTGGSCFPTGDERQQRCHPPPRHNVTITSGSEWNAAEQDVICVDFCASSKISFLDQRVKCTLR